MTDYLALANEQERLRDWFKLFDQPDSGKVDACERAAAALREAHAELQRAEAGMDSYATENQQFHDEIERLRALLNRAESFMSNVPTDEQLDARMQSGDCGRDVWGDIHDALKEGT